jgi:hypothetical protein
MPTANGGNIPRLQTTNTWAGEQFNKKYDQIL